MDSEFLTSRFGTPGFIETDPYRTAGGHEWNWAYAFADGLKVLMEYHVPVKSGVLYAEPAEAERALEHLGVTAAEIGFVPEVPPVISLAYSGPCDQRG